MVERVQGHVQTADVNFKPASFFVHSIDSTTITKSLYTLNGMHGNIGVSTVGGRVSKCVFDTSHSPSKTDFLASRSKTAVVVDIDVICFDDKRYGLVVAVNDPSSGGPDAEQDDKMLTKKEKAARAERNQNCVQLWVPDVNGKFFHVRSIQVFGEITCVRVLISPMDMAAQKPFVSEKIGKWPNIVAIGCKKSSCFLGQFADFDPRTVNAYDPYNAVIGGVTEEVKSVAATTDALKSIIGRNGRFNYTMASGQVITFDKDGVEVTAISYIPCYAVVVVGLSNGGIVLVPLDGKSSMTCLNVQYQTPVRHLVVLEPEFDPQGGFYIFAAKERPAGDRAALVTFSHKVSRAANTDGGHDYHDMSSVMIPLKDGAYWINVHGVVSKRRRSREAAETSMNTTGDSSQLPEGLNTTQHMYNDGMERTLLFYSYISTDGQMKGGLFDLNAFYSRRCSTQQVRFDEFLQDPICSQFVLEPPVKRNGELLFRTKDISFVHCQDVTRYTSAVFDREPLFQPMAAHLALHIHTFGECAYSADVESLQWRLLEKMGRYLPETLAAPAEPLRLLERVGLELAPATRKERTQMEERPANERVPVELDKILRAIVVEPDTRQDLIGLIDKCEDRKQLLHIGRFMFNLLREIVVRVDEAIIPLLDGSRFKELSPAGQATLTFCTKFFEHAELVFWKVRGRGIELFNDTTTLRYARKLHALMAFSLRLFLDTLRWMTWRLPIYEPWTGELQLEVHHLNEERKDKATREEHPLFLHALLGRLHEKTQDDELWCGMADPASWYPPTRFNLVSLLRQSEADLADRTALIYYVLMDMDEVLERNRKRPKEERKAYPDLDIVGEFDAHVARKLLVEEAETQRGVKERWESDMKGRPAVEQVKVPAEGGTSKLSKAEKEDFEALKKMYRIFRILQQVDEDRMREIFNKMGWGEFRWSVLMINKSRWPEVQDLELPPPPFPHKVFDDYRKYKDMALRVKAELPPYRGGKFAPRAPYAVTKKVASSSAAPDETTLLNASSASTSNVSRLFSSNITVRGKTPKKLNHNLFNRLLPLQAAAGSASTSLMATPPGRSGDAAVVEPSADVARINALMKTPKMRFRQQDAFRASEEGAVGEGSRANNDNSDIAPDEMARVREALRTPRSRVNLAARRDVGTPEEQARPVLAPTSILKSAHKHSRLPQSAIKSKLRFAQVFEEKTISPRDNTSMSTTASVSKPNFDDSFDNEEQEAAPSTSSAAGDTSALSMTTRLEREIEEEEHDRLVNEAAEREGREGEAGGRGGGGEEMEEAAPSMDPHELSSQQPLSLIEEEEVTEERMEEEEKEEEKEGETAGAGDTFAVYHDSDCSDAPPSTTTDDEAEVAFVSETIDNEEKEEQPADLPATAPATDTKTPPPTPEDEQEEKEQDEPEKEEETVAPPANDDDEEEQQNLSRATTPVETEEKDEEEAMGLKSEQQPAADATFTVEARGGGEEEGEEKKDEKEEEEKAADNSSGKEKETDEVMVVEPREEEQEEPAADLPADLPATAPADTKTPPPTPEDEEEKEQEDEEKKEKETAASSPPANDDEEEKEEQENVSRASTPVQQEEKEVAEAMEEEQEQEAPEEKEELAAPSAPAAALPPRPKPRTIYSTRAEPIALGLRSYIFMEDGIEKSYEEALSDDDEEKEKKEEDGDEILARLGRRSNSRLQQGGQRGGEDTVAGSGIIRKRSSRGRADSEKDTAGPSTSKRDRKDEEEKEMMEEGGEQGAHIHTTTRTRIVEERTVARDDGVLQHTTKQCTKVIETMDGVVVAQDQEDSETIEEEGDRAEEMMDEADRTTPPAMDAAASPSTDRRESIRMPKLMHSDGPTNSRSRTRSTASSVSLRSKEGGEKDEEEKEKKEAKRDEKASTPLCSPTKTARRRRLMTDEDDEKEKEKEKEQEEKQPEEPATPRRSTRARKPSESTSTVPQTPSKGTTRASSKAKTPSRQSSAAPSSPVRRAPLVVTDEKEEKEAAASTSKPTPAKRGRPRKEPVDTTAAAEKEEDVVVPVLAKRRTTIGTGIATRQRSASESVQKAKKTAGPAEEEEIVEIDHIAILAKQLEEQKARLAKKRKERAARLGLPLPTVPEDAAAAGADQPSTSQAPLVASARSSTATRRKRTQSETVATTAKDKKEEDTIMKTPSKKKAKETEKDEEEGAPDQSMLRRSSRKAAATANEGLKTPSKSSKKNTQ